MLLLLSRISDDIDQTINMVKDFETLGVSAVAVHGRTRQQTYTDPVDKRTFHFYSFLPHMQIDSSFPFFAISDAIRKIAESVKIPIIANGGSINIKSFTDIENFKEECGATSVMVARAAQENVSVFRKEGAC